MEATEMFNILNSVDSTNNYAMGMVHAGMAKHGMAWFAHDQTAGKGQQGKVWETAAGQNLALSIVLQPGKPFARQQFFFSAVIANTCYEFFKSYAGTETSVKWPNDIYWRDRKAGGILIENKLMGENWKWAVVGIGININQTEFTDQLSRAVSLKQVSGNNYDPAELARILHARIVHKINATTQSDFPGILKDYNDHLYLRNSSTRLKKDNIIFETCIKGVNEFGQLITEDAVERIFNFGEVEWVGNS